MLLYKNQPYHKHETSKIGIKIDLMYVDISLNIIDCKSNCNPLITNPNMFLLTHLSMLDKDDCLMMSIVFSAIPLVMKFRHKQYTIPSQYILIRSRFSLKMPYEYRDSRFKNNTVSWSPFPYNGNSYSSKTTSLYWVGPKTRSVEQFCIVA